MMFALNVTSILLAFVALALAWWASLRFRDPSWNGQPPAEPQYRLRKILAATSLSLAILTGALQLYLAYRT
jgi:hypothetical protein